MPLAEASPPGPAAAAVGAGAQGGGTLWGEPRTAQAPRCGLNAPNPVPNASFSLAPVCGAPSLAPTGLAVPVSTRPSPLLPGYITSSRRVLVSTPQTPPWNGAGRGGRVGDPDRFRLAAGWDSGDPADRRRSPAGSAAPAPVPGRRSRPRERRHSISEGRVVSGLSSEMWVGRSAPEAGGRRQARAPSLWD